jgi:hypothetical protein
MQLWFYFLQTSRTSTLLLNMGVAVNEPWDGQFTSPVDYLIVVFLGEVAVDLRDLALFDENVPARQQMSGLQNGDVLYQHQRKIAARDKKIIESSGLRSTDPKMGSGLR